MRPRHALTAVALALVVLIPGCISLPSLGAKDDRYAGFDAGNVAPANSTVKPKPGTPTKPTTPSAPAKPKPADPGLVVKAAWKVGDTWTYRTVEGTLEGAETTLRVVAAPRVGKAGAFLVKSELRLRNQPTPHVSYQLFDAATYAILNGSSEDTRFRSTPSDLTPRFLKNGSFNFTYTRTIRTSDEERPERTSTLRKNVTVELVGRVKLKTEAGTFDTTQFTLTTRYGDVKRPGRIDHRWYSVKTLNDVYTMNEDGSERMELVRYSLAPR